MTPKELKRRARARGIQTSYVNAAGKTVQAAPGVLRDLLEAFGDEADEPAPVIVAWDGKTTRLGAFPFGYHPVSVNGVETLVISAPSRSYSDPEVKRAWGVFAPMYALRGEGGFAEWRNLVDWLQPLGAHVVATLPLLATFLRPPTCEPSPYSPASRLFWNELHVSLQRESVGRGAPPEPRGSARTVRSADSGPTELLDYVAMAEAKRKAIERVMNVNSKPFQIYRASHPRLDDYAAFRAAGEKLGCSWRTWPERMRNGNLRPGDYDARARNYHAYAQWLAQGQMDDLLEHCRAKGVRFYLDLPLGVHPDGYDAWRERDSFALNVSVGAPPDLYFTKGQDWGFSPLHPQAIRRNRYRYLIEYLRFQMRHTGMLRIDHVMGLHRLYWIPKGRPASEGAYVQYPAEEIYAILCLESHRHRTVLVGENLGTVPPEVNESMDRHGLRRMYVLQYELSPRRLPRPPRKSVASLNTHDMPTFEAFLRGLDIDDRHDLGLVRNLPQARRERERLVAALRKFLRNKSDLLETSMRWLANSDAEVVLLNLEDLWRETLPQNVPGTSCERPNWQRRLKYSIDELRGNSEVRRLLRLVADARAQPPPTGFRGRVSRMRASAAAPRRGGPPSPKKARG